MATLVLKAKHQTVKNWSAKLKEFCRHRVSHRGVVRSGLENFSQNSSRKDGWPFVAEYGYPHRDHRPASIDGGTVDAFTIERHIRN
jgi:hypothetical protein